MWSTPHDVKEKKKALTASKAQRRVIVDQLARELTERARSHRPLTDAERKSIEADMNHKTMGRAERSVLERALEEVPSVEAAEKKKRVASAVRNAVACCVHGDITDAVAEMHKHVSPLCEDADRFKIAEDIPAHVHAAFLELGFEEAAVQSCRRLLDDVTGLLVRAVRGETTLTLAAGDLAVLERHMPDLRARGMTDAGVFNVEGLGDARVVDLRCPADAKKEYNILYAQLMRIDHNLRAAYWRYKGDARQDEPKYVPGGARMQPFKTTVRGGCDVRYCGADCDGQFVRWACYLCREKPYYVCGECWTATASLSTTSCWTTPRGTTRIRRRCSTGMQR